MTPEQLLAWMNANDIVMARVRVSDVGASEDFYYEELDDAETLVTLRMMKP